MYRTFQSFAEFEREIIRGHSRLTDLIDEVPTHDEIEPEPDSRRDELNFDM